MKPAAEFLGFASVAALAHLAVFAATVPDGRAAGGDGGAESVTVAAPLGVADADIAALVRQWDTPPRLPEPAAPASPGPSPDAAPTLPASPAAALPRLPQTMPLATPPADTAMASNTAPPPPLFDKPGTRTTPRPRARPEPRHTAPDPRPTPQQAAQPSARSAGQGQATQQGQGRAPASSGATPTASLLSEWGGAIRAAVQRQQSSPGTRARGTVQVQLQVSTDGRLVHVAVMQSSGHAALDQAALQAVQRARLPRAPAGLSGSFQFNLPLGYR